MANPDAREAQREFLADPSYTAHGMVRVGLNGIPEGVVDRTADVADNALDAVEVSLDPPAEAVTPADGESRAYRPFGMSEIFLDSMVRGLSNPVAPAEAPVDRPSDSDQAAAVALAVHGIVDWQSRHCADSTIRNGAQELFSRYGGQKHKVLMAYLNGELDKNEIEFANDLFDEDELSTISDWHRSRAQWHRQQAALTAKQAAETRNPRGIRIRNSSQEQS
jgi:hypothetical protein